MTNTACIVSLGLVSSTVCSVWCPSMIGGSRVVGDVTGVGDSRFSDGVAYDLTQGRTIVF